MVFGDDFNDLGLFKLCGLPIAMENSIEELKSFAKEITTSNDEDGVANILEKLLK
jgi:hydroxymethylpyrimidine pyrophosphatase-like HAD family hydrolase